MPTYQYHCTECGHDFEAFQSMVDPVLEECPKCHGKVRRLITGGAGFIFKGNGFYQTDYRSKQYKADAAKDTASASSSPSKSSGDKKKTQSI